MDLRNFRGFGKFSGGGGVEKFSRGGVLRNFRGGVKKFWEGL